MKYRFHPALIVALILVLCVAVVFVAASLRSHPDATIKGLLARIPPEESVVLGIDVRAMRRAGILEAVAGSPVTEEPEYKDFVTETGFDYREDLDLVLVSFQKNATYLLVRGRFDWKKLTSFAISQLGVCHNSLCRMKGSTPQRNISFFPVSRGLMALAVSADSWAVTRLAVRHRSDLAFPVPDQPVWLHIPVSSLKDHSRLPSGTHKFAEAMEGARTITLSIGPREGRLEAMLDVTCRSQDDATSLVGQLEEIARLLQKMIEQANEKPNPRDLSGVLTAGTFRSAGVRVEGRWPVERAYLENLKGVPF